MSAEGPDSNPSPPARSDIPQPPPEALHRAVALHQAGQLAEAERIYRAILDAAPDQFDALHSLGVIAAQRRHFEQAHDLLRRALEVNPRSADANANHANVLNALRRFDEALACSDRALSIDPRDARAFYNRGLALHHLQRLDDALASYDRALALRPDFAEALCNRGAALLDLKRYEEAVASFDRALALKPGHVEALYNRGLSLQYLQRYQDALASYGKALALRPDFAEAENNVGLNLQCLRRYEEALTSYDKALAIRPDFAEALYNRGAALSSMRRHEGAVRDVERALSLNPALPYARGTLLHSRMYCCDWRSHDEDVGRIIADVRAGKRSAEPATILNISSSAEDQLICARTWVNDKVPPARISAQQRPLYRHDRIRLAYLSTDFHEHATGYLMAGLFDRHDKNRFETTAVSMGPDTPSEMRTRLQSAFERFIDVRHMSDGDVADLLRKLEIDIAVDLKGFTDGARTGILTQRPAPIQVNYLGYPGTMGATYIDYIVADRVVIPPEQHRSYAEKVIYLPDTYQVNDSLRRIATRTPTRAELGLPETGFVFCSFNNSYKITPSLFALWMRLLHRVEGSVLWLLEGDVPAPGNLRREAANCGIAPDRLVFAPKLKLEEHLARHRRADLFLDTLPCNAHTTASDALWAGLPVLTCLGTTFAGRVAGSLLHAIGLPELVTRSLDEYETQARKLATDAALLAEIQQKLSRHRASFPLFDTDRFRRHIEAAYSQMWERYSRGQPPASFAVAPTSTQAR
jgi:protein O-GlcNAc transferase